MVNPQAFFDSLSDGGAVSKESKALLEKIMAIKNPKDFDDDVATIEQLNTLEDELIQLKKLEPEVERFVSIALKLKPVIMANPMFI